MSSRAICSTWMWTVTWEDADADGDYEIHDAGSGDEGPELFVARIYTGTLSYDTEANMVNGYFSKAHAYRTGALTPALARDWNTWRRTGMTWTST